MKRIIALVLCLMLLCTPTFAEQSGLMDKVTVGTHTPLSGHFFTSLWGNNTSDMDVRTLLHGLGTVAWGGDGNFELNPAVIADSGASDNDDGSRTYRFELNADLKYSDGTAIAAQDYAFAVLLLASPELSEIADGNSQYNHLAGYEDYRDGQPFSGVRLYSDDEFSLTVKPEYSNYFYELMLVEATPYPIGVIAPGCGVADDGAGAYITGNFSGAMLNESVLDAETGYMSHPAVTSGAYVLDDYDAEAGVAQFSINPYFPGDINGAVPSIERLEFRYVSAADALEAVKSGEIDIVNKVTDGDVIRAALEDGAVRTENYPRSGLNFLSFACEIEPTSSASVRQAISFALDVPVLIEEYMPGFGLPVNGYYGLGQWMAQENMQALVELARYEYNLNAAQQLLDNDGWLVPDGGGTRVKDGNALVIRWAKTKESGISDALEATLAENLAAIGIELAVEELDFSQVLRQYYRQDERRYNMFNLATNFSVVFDPSQTFNVGDEYQGILNTTGIRDEQLMELAQAMVRTESGDTEGYVARWLEFQSRFMEVLPLIPLYTNVYFDIVNPVLSGYSPASHQSWAQAIISASFGGEQPETVLEDDLDDGEIIIID